MMGVYQRAVDTLVLYAVAILYKTAVFALRKLRPAAGTKTRA